MNTQQYGRSIVLVIGLLMGITLGAARVEAAKKVSFSGTMILASNESGPTDAQLKKYEGKLRRLFKFKRYRHFGHGGASIEIPGKAAFSLGNGYRMQVDVSPAPKNQIRAGVRWVKGKRNLINTVLVMQKGVPTILGGPSHEGGNLIVILEAN